MGQYLLVRVTYDTNSYHGITAYQVRADVADEDNSAPGFGEDSGVRMVDEDTAVGGNVGDPVVDTDEPNDDRLTYSLRPAAAPNAGDLSFFTIDQETGQITLMRKLSHEGTTADGVTIDGRAYPETDSVTPGVYIVVVRATDPSGDANDENSADITVTITARDVNEAPRIVSGNSELVVDENASLPDPDATIETNRYQRLDEDANDIASVWRLKGADAALFQIGTPAGGNIARRIHFLSAPDYEDPQDMLRDNIYEVTLVVCDRAGDCGEKDVRIKVMNVAEDGMLTLSPRQPEPDVPVVAILTDGDGILTEADGVETIGKWAWYYTVTAADYTIDDTGTISGTPPTLITGATTSSYTPSEDDLGRYLYATVKYRDGMAPDTARWLIAGTEFAVQKDPGDAPPPGQGNAAPEFDPMEVMFEVPENTPSTGFVGQHPDGATDAEDDATDPATLLTYDLSGADADSFALASPNRATYYAVEAAPFLLSLTPVQIAVMPVTHLDYESKMAYSFELEATDSEGAMSSATVMVTVTNVNEAPSAPVEFIGGLGVTGPSTATVPEVAEGAEASGPIVVATYEAARLPRGATASSVRWSLDGDDKDDFTINGGELAFKNAPNFEMPMDEGTNNSYEVMVKAMAGGEEDSISVTVTVRNLDEGGTVTLPSERPEVGQAITAELTDPDGSIRIDRWEWYKAELITDTFNLIPETVVGSGTVSDTYTPVAADANWFLRANVFYSDGEGAGKDAEEIAMGGTIQIAPMFDGDAAERSVGENTVAGMNVGDPVTASDPGDTLIYTLGGADAASFAINKDTGQLMTMAALNYETKASYTVTVIATDTARASDEITVTVTVTNVEELGMVDLSARPVVGTELTASVTDRDNVVDGSVAWQWASSATMDGTFEDISGAMAAAYTPVAEDAGMYLRATASYSDGEGSGKTDDQIAMYPVNMPPMFDAAEATRSVAEGTAAGMNVGDPITAMDEGDTLTYALGGADMRSFAIDDMGQITVGTGTALDYETTTSYTVTVTATDAAGASDEVMVTITVTNVDEEGMVDLDAEQPVVGIALTASVTDPDGDVTGETWQWASSATMDGDYTNIEGAGAMKAAYTPTMDDKGMYLRATAAYNDGVGDADSAMMATAEAVVSYSSPHSPTMPPLQSTWRKTRLRAATSATRTWPRTPTATPRPTP